MYPDFDSVSWAIEMEAMWWGENSNSYFKLEDIDKNRTLEKAFYPQDNLDYDPRAKSSLPKLKGEIRIIGLDVALMKGAKNDNSIFTLMRIVPNGSAYQRQVVYMEHMNGGHSEAQAIRLRQLYDDFEADYVCLDCQGIGMSIFDNCIKTLYDKERDIEYPAWTCFNDKAMAERCIAPDAMPVIYSMKVTSAMLNHEIAVNLREDLKQGRIKLLANDKIAQRQLQTYKSAKLDLNISDIEDTVDLYTKKSDYVAAIKIVKNAITEYGEDKRLTSLFTSLKKDIV